MFLKIPEFKWIALYIILCNDLLSLELFFSGGEEVKINTLIQMDIYRGYKRMSKVFADADIQDSLINWGVVKELNVWRCWHSRLIN